MTSDSTNRAGPNLATEDLLLLGVVLFLPWVFGGVEIWAVRLAGLVLVAAAGVALVRDGWAGWGLGRSADRFWLLPAMLLAVWAAFQLMPLPPAVIRLLSPGAHAVYSAAIPGYGNGNGGAENAIVALEEAALERVPEASSATLPQPSPQRFDLEPPACLSRSWLPLSLEPGATEDRLFWFVALLLGFLVLRRRLAQRARRRFYLTALFVDFTALALFALVQAQTWNGKLYWLRPVRRMTSPFGPYINPNHFAGVMELAVPALFGFVCYRLLRGGRSALYEGRFAGGAIGAGICLVAGIAAASKLAALLLAAGLLGVGLSSVRSRRARATVALVALVLGVLSGLVMVATPLGERVQSFVEGANLVELPLEGRLVVWSAGSRMLADFPLTGVGFGAFREVFPRYTPAGSRARWAQAHNDYLEVVLDGGLVAGLLLLWLIVGFGRRVWRGLPSRESPRFPAWIGLVVGVLSLAIHALFEFNHQMPANALLFVTFGALLVPEERKHSAEERSR